MTYKRGSFFRGIRGICRLVVGLALLVGLCPNSAQAGTQSPHGRRCRNVGPIAIDANWCGCTWGEVYVNGQAVRGARIAIQFSSGLTTTQTFDDGGAENNATPFYATHADGLGARYGDSATVSAMYGGNILTRTVRLIPNADGEQQLNFVFPSRGYWQHYAAPQAAPVTTINAIAVSSNTVWVGGMNGLVSWNLSTGLSTTHNLGLPSSDVRALVAISDSQVWAGTADGLAHFDGSAWTAQNTGLLSSHIRALAVAPNGAVVAGAYDALNGGISALVGNIWQPLPDVNGALPNLVTALAFDRTGALWVGSDGYGVTRWDGTHGQTFNTQNGLSSDVISGIAAEPGAVWLTTRAYVNANGPLGGVTRFDLATQSGVAYTQTHGLSANDVLGVVIDSTGVKWFNTVDGGISAFDGLNWWYDNIHSGLAANTIRALAAQSDGVLWAGSAGGINRFSRTPFGTPPQMDQISVTPTKSLSGEPITFRAAAQDTDNNGGSILAYEWTSDRDGILGSEAVFNSRTGWLSAGIHLISVRAMDDEGMWSAPLTATLTIQHPRLMFLPLIRR